MIALFKVTGKLKGGTNPYDRGHFSNCNFTLCGPVWPKLAVYGFMHDGWITMDVINLASTLI